jgi:hypothetical protein
MPFNETRTAAFYVREVLRTVSGSEIAENAVLDGTQVALNADGRRIVESGTVMVYAGVSEVQTLTISATGGTFTASFGGQTTGALAWNVSAANLQAALQGLSSIGADNVVVTGADGGPYTITFSGALAGRDVAQITTTPSLTGGAGTATVTTGTVGGSAKARTQKVIPAPTSGVVAADVAGILMHTLELWPGTVHGDKDDAPVALWTQNCDFSTPDLTNYSGNAAAVKSAMEAGGVGRCANCKFSL